MSGVRGQGGEREIRCSAYACDLIATETLYLRNQRGHVHDCPTHAHDLREFCDVIASIPIEDGRLSRRGLHRRSDLHSPTRTLGDPMTADPTQDSAETVTQPAFVRSLSRGGEVSVEPLELDADAKQRIAEQLENIEASRAAAIATGASYVISGASDEDYYTFTAAELRERDARIAARLAALAESGPPERLCSQCGERMSCMVKVGTEDGWCEACLDEAADDGLAERIRALADEWDGTSIAPSETSTLIHLAAELRAVLGDDGKGSR